MENCGKLQVGYPIREGASTDISWARHVKTNKTKVLQMPSPEVDLGGGGLGWGVRGKEI